jgi:chemotaxis protein MotB
MSGAPGPKVIIIKKKAKGHGHHGGAWKVAYADFVTAMMALFIVLWLLTQSDAHTKEVISEYFRTGTMPGGSLLLGKTAGSNPPKAIDILPPGYTGGLSQRKRDAIAKSLDRLLARAAADPSTAAIAKGVKVKITAKGALIELVDSGEDLLFAVSSSELKPGVVKFLEQLAPVIAEANEAVEIHGHTDSRSYRESKKTNWDLSYERAERARRVLEAHGVPHGRIDGVLAHADTQPYVEKDPLAPQNRRLSILIKPEEPPESVRPGENEGLREGHEPGGGLIMEPGLLKREAEKRGGDKAEKRGGDKADEAEKRGEDKAEEAEKRGEDKAEEADKADKKRH